MSRMGAMASAGWKRDMVRLRLQRFGKKNWPFYRLVAADARSPRDGKCLEYLGTYNPLPTKHGEKFVTLNYDVGCLLVALLALTCSLPEDQVLAGGGCTTYRPSGEVARRCKHSAFQTRIQVQGTQGEEGVAFFLHDQPAHGWKRVKWMRAFVWLVYAVYT